MIFSTIYRLIDLSSLKRKRCRRIKVEKFAQKRIFQSSLYLITQNLINSWYKTSAMGNLKLIDLRLKRIEERNKKVELDKYWETSYSRRILLIAFTFFFLYSHYYCALCCSQIVAYLDFYKCIMSGTRDWAVETFSNEMRCRLLSCERSHVLIIIISEKSDFSSHIYVVSNIDVILDCVMDRNLISG